MNPKTIFKLHEPQHGVDAEQQKDTYVYMFFSYGYNEILNGSGRKKKYIPLKYSTGLMIKPCFWDDRPVYRAKNDSFKKAEIFNQRLDFFQDSIIKVFTEYENFGIIPSPVQLKDRFNVLIKNELKKPLVSLIDYISKFISEAKNGNRLTAQNRKYRTTSIKNLIGFQVQIEHYQKSISITLDFDKITGEFLTDFIQFFKDKNYSQNTISRHVKHLRMFMRAAKEEGLHSNTEIDHQRFKVNQQEVLHVYLNEIELQQLLNLDLSKKPKLEIVRDVFLLGCYIGQRYSDYKTINKNQIVQLDDENIAVEILQSKTSKRIILPLRTEAENILKKYNYSLPYTYEQIINTKIQEIAKLAGIDDLTETYATIRGKRVVKKVPRYKLIKTHTARRSGCTNMYLANVPINEIMTISGHQTVFDFMKYIRASEFQIAKKLSMHPYFSGAL